VEITPLYSATADALGVIGGNLAAITELGEDTGKALNSRGVVIVITDGDASDKQAIEEAKVIRATNKDVDLIVVGINQQSRVHFQEFARNMHPCKLLTPRIAFVENKAVFDDILAVIKGAVVAMAKAVHPQQALPAPKGPTVLQLEDFSSNRAR
jgi:hypothetical protein